MATRCSWNPTELFREMLAVFETYKFESGQDMFAALLSGYLRQKQWSSTFFQDRSTGIR